MIATPRNNPSEQSVPEISAQNTKDTNPPGWNPCKPYGEDAPVVVKRHAKVTNDAKLYLLPS